MMKLRKLDIEEHGKTRSLWEQGFSEDSRSFLDYYYFFKARENQIYVVEQEEEIRSMLQLNPYMLQVEDGQFTGHYIIAVATEAAYRKRGYMGALLRRAMQDMYDKKELFTFLMPAAEAIYLPYDFRYVYAQNVWEYEVEENTERNAEEENSRREVSVSEAGIGDGEALAEFFNTHFAKCFQVYAVRKGEYYQTMLFEQQSENGGIRILKRNRQIIGSFLYGDEDGLEIREPVYLKAYESDFRSAVRQLCEERRQKKAVIYAGEHGTKKPVIMARLLHLESLLKVLKARSGEEVSCSFAVVDSVLPQNSRVWRLRSKCLVSEEEADREATSGDFVVRETEDSEGVLSIAALTSLLFGQKKIAELNGEPDVFLTDHLAEELGKIQPLQRICLNEIV